MAGLLFFFGKLFRGSADNIGRGDKMPIEGGDVKLFWNTWRYDPNNLDYDIELHARNVGLKYGVEGVTPQVLRMAMQSQDTHVGGCNLYKDNPVIVRERLQAIVRSLQGPSDIDRIIDGLLWLRNAVKKAILFIFGLRRSASAAAPALEAHPTPEQVAIDAIKAQAETPRVDRTPEQVVIDAMRPPVEAASHGIAPLFSPQGAQGMVGPQQAQMPPLQMIQMQNAAAVQGAIQMMQVRAAAPVVMPVMPFIDIP